MSTTRTKERAIANAQRERRERIATAALQGLLSSWPDGGRLNPNTTAACALSFTDALIAELDKT